MNIEATPPSLRLSTTDHASFTETDRGHAYFTGKYGHKGHVSFTQSDRHKGHAFTEIDTDYRLVQL